MSYLQVTQLNKSYGPTQIFHNIDFSAEEGEFVTLLGPSGCGKSTLLRCLAGLTSVDSGKILIQGQDIVPLPPQQRGIGIWTICPLFMSTIRSDMGSASS